MARIVAGARYPTSDGALLEYLNVLDWVLDDLVITQTERKHMAAVASDLGIDPRQLDVVYREVVDAACGWAVYGGVVSVMVVSM